ncbi:MAG: hypothetical protein IT208_07525 [Chthonomonadales bacterium]|nr:hypothetical protein [Chthonomonadales bacterium]
MSRRRIGTAIFGSILIALLFFMFLRGERVSALQYNVASVFAALCAGLLAYFIAGSLTVGGTLPERLGGLKVDAAGGLAIFVLTFVFFAQNRPPDTAPIQGYLYSGTPEAPGDPVVGARVLLLGDGAAPVTTVDLGRFVFPAVSAAQPRIVFEPPGGSATSPAPLAPDGRYFLRRRAVQRFRSLDAARYRVEPQGPAVAGVATYAVRPTIERRDDEADLDGLDLRVGPLSDGNEIEGEPRVSDVTAIPDDLDRRQAGWLLRMDDRDVAAPTITLRLRRLGDTGAVTASDVPISYRFRVYPGSLPGGPP